MDTRNGEMEKIEQRTVQYWFQDGIFEISFGLYLLLLSLLFVGFALAQPGSALYFWLGVGFLPAFLLGGWLSRKLIRSLKRKLTYPRTGYVSYRRPEGKNRLVRSLLIGAAAGIIAALSVVLFSPQQVGFNILPGVSGLACAIAFGLLALRSGLVRFALLTVFSIAVGIALAFVNWHEMLGLALFYAALAILLIISGLTACLFYLRQNPTSDKVSP